MNSHTRGTERHTPGPWNVAALDDYTVVAGRRHIADCANSNVSKEDEANARLIAAAPDMLDALRAVNDLWNTDALSFPDEMNMGSPVGSVWARVRVAIAKAEGRHE